MSRNRLIAILAVGLVLAASTARADSDRAARPGFEGVPQRVADSRDRDYRDRDADYRDRDRRDRDSEYRDRDSRKGDSRDYRESRDRRDYREWRPPVQRGRGPVAVPPGRVRHYRDVVVARPHGHWYSGYGHYRTDDEAYKWLSFTAITLGILDFLNEAQERALESAQVRATSAPVGEAVHWNDGGASGSVTAIREGTTTSGRYCREFQQTVTIGGRAERAFGTACQQADGSWEVISTGN